MDDVADGTSSNGIVRNLKRFRHLQTDQRSVGQAPDEMGFVPGNQLVSQNAWGTGKKRSDAKGETGPDPKR